MNDIQKKGFAVLHGKWGGAKMPRSLIGMNGRQESGKYVIGYLAYPNVSLKNMIPDRRFFGYEELIRRDRPPEINGLSRPRRRDSRIPPSGWGIGFKTHGPLEQSVTKSEYIKKIKQIKGLLADGEIYQMCYCIRFRKKFGGNPYSLFLKSTETNPADFAAYLNCGEFQIISSSPERFFNVRDGVITTTPIKGTISKKNEKNLKKLLESEKERAELDMITDLERNDVGKICEFGTLKLKKERGVLELNNLWHTYSEVEGKLRSDVGPEEVISAMFPGGSITGCPKKRAMEYISLLEGLPRNVFTGSIGYIEQKSKIENRKSNFCMDFNIAIRTILIKDGMMEFWAGGGIVADSDPEKEYEECHLKAERFLGIIKNR